MLLTDLQADLLRTGIRPDLDHNNSVAEESLVGVERLLAMAGSATVI